MSRPIVVRAILALAVLAGSVWLVATKPPRLGLDLRGGTQIVLETRDSKLSKANAKTTDETIEVLRRRVAGQGGHLFAASGAVGWLWSRHHGRSTSITGDFSVNEAKDLALLIRTGALPVPVDVIEQRTVGPTLGQAAIDASAQAAIIGVIATILFIIAVYRLVGGLAAVALIAYGLISYAALLASLSSTRVRSPR